MKKYLEYLILAIVCLVVLSSITIWKIAYGYTYFFIMAGLFAFFLVTEIKYRLNVLALTIIVAGFISIIFNEVPVFFRPWERLSIFIVVAGLVGPFISNDQLDTFRIGLLNWLNRLIVTLVGISTIGIVLGLPLMSGFSGINGFFNHSMMLGPMSAISLVCSLFMIFEVNSPRHKAFFSVVISLSFIALVASGSRSAIVSGLAGILIFFYKYYQQKINNFFRVVLLSFFILFASYPLWENQTKFMMQKIQLSEKEGDFFYSRMNLWTHRVDEFRSSPVYGIGFASVNTSISKNFDPKSGTIEPGSSWLAILAMLGLAGFIPFCWLVIRNFSFLFRCDENRLHSSLLLALLTIFMLHMFAEGYVLSAGSALFFYFWLLLGVIENYRNIESSALEKQ